MEITDKAIETWLEEIEHSRKREKDFRKNGKEINEIYNGEMGDSTPFNILYSNTETLKPALYSQTPRPVVKRRFNQGESPAVEAAEKAGTRILEYFIDTNIEGYEKFDDAMGDAVLDSALPGRGVTQIRFDAIMEGEGEDETLKWAFVCAESRKWDNVYFGFAKKWAKMPWIAFEEYLDKEECTKLFGAKADEIEYSESDEDEDNESSDTGDKTGRETALIYQIWDKSDKKVKWISPQYDGYLKEQDDPLDISGFYPIPKPLRLHRKSNNLIPTALYTLYENQAIELNRISTRLNYVIEAIKVRGIYDGALGAEIENILEEDDAGLVPAEKGSSLLEGSFDRAIWFMPIEKLVNTAQTLIGAREQCKSVIYEITGLSDVIRGSSKASETLGAQKIKESWGTMRLKNQQKDVQAYVRDTLRIMLDVASQKIPARFWKDLTGLPYPSAEEKQNAQMQLQALKQQAQQKMMQQQQQAQQMIQMGQQPPKPQPPQPPPSQLMQQAQMPSWEEILEILRDDLTRSYKIDIETNSTLDIEATEDQAQVSEFMNAMAQFMNGTMPMVKEKVLPFGAAKAMFLEIARRFRFGIDVEDQIKKMEEPKGPDPEQIKKQQEEMKKKAQEMQKQAEAKKQELDKQAKTIEDQKLKAGQELDKKFIELKEKMMEFEFDKKLFAKEAQFMETMATKDRQMEFEKAGNEIGTLMEKTKRDMQSMLDSHKTMIQSTIKIAEAKEAPSEQE